MYPQTNHLAFQLLWQILYKNIITLYIFIIITELFFVIGSRRLVRTLLTLGANPNAQDNAEWSPLHEACNRGNLGVVRLLHKHGADINLKGFGRDTPLHDAARNGQLKVTNYFIHKHL